MLRTLEFEHWWIAPPASMIRRTCITTLLMIMFAGAFSLTSWADCKQPTSLPPLETSQPRNLDGLKSQLVYYECSGSYDRDFNRIIAKATAYVLQRATGNTKLALVLDIDETSLSNWEQIKANDFGHISHGTCNNLPSGPCADDAWQRLAAAKVIEPTLKLFKVAKTKNVAVFFITGRPENVREATEMNLHRVGYTDWTDLILRPVGDTSAVQQFKTAKRKEITERGYTIIVSVGDQYSDLKGGYAERAFKVPNPFYFIP